MNDFLTKISGQIAGPIILSAFFPVVLFFTGLTLIVLPITPYLQPLNHAVAILKLWDDKTTAMIFLTLVVLVAAVALSMLNVPIIRLYEGYPWRDSWIGGKFTEAERGRLNDILTLRRLIKKLRKDLRIHKLRIADDGLIEAQRVLARAANDEYPGPSLVLPTRLGNTIRSFETYPLEQYGFPAIAVWPRLQAVLPAPYVQGLDGAQTSFNFMLNCSFLSALLAALLVICGLLWRHPFSANVDRTWLVWLALLAIVWRLFYFGAINRAAEWGAQVRAAFDLYRGPLLTQLGYDFKPETPAEERRIWEAINYKLSFPDDHDAAELPYKKQPTSVLADPPWTVLSVARTVSFAAPDILRVKVIVKNDDLNGYDAKDVLLCDDIPTGQKYVSDSTAIDGIPRQPIGFAPLRICLGTLPAGQQRVLRYQVKVVQ